MKNIKCQTIVLIVMSLFCSPSFSDQVSVHSVDHWSPDLFENFQPVPGFAWTFSIMEPSYLFVTGHIDTAHRGIAGTANEAIFVAFKIKLNDSWLPGSTTGENIVGVKDHYYSAQIHGFSELQPGNYTVEVHGRSASSAAPGVNGLAEVKANYNQVVYRVVPIN